MRSDLDEEILKVCRRATRWAAARDYAGYSKHDALNSPLLRHMTFGRKWPRLLITQVVMRSPINLRPLLGVRTARNPKGIALFARAHLNLFRATGERQFRREAESLLDWLLQRPSNGFSGASWGYPYPWQDLGFFAPEGFPNRIVTYFVGRTLVEAFEQLGERRYLLAAERAVRFILDEPRVLFENEKMKCLSYVPVPEIEMVVMDVSALCGALCAMVGHHTGRADLLAEAVKLVAYVADKQTDYGAWYYTHPAGDSPVTHDNYHTGEILDAIADYERYTGDASFHAAYTKGLEYYRRNLFTEEGRPKWMADRVFPHDAHGYSQGIITFLRAGEPEMARRIARRALDDLWIERRNRFRYQKCRFYSKRFTLMRWSQAWLTYAMSQLAVLTAGRRDGARQVQ